MLQIHQSVEKTVKKFLGYSLCFLLLIITFCNIFIFNCSADEVRATSSSSGTVVQSTEIFTESITSSTEEKIEISNNKDVSVIFYFRFIIVLFIIILFLIIVNKLF